MVQVVWSRNAQFDLRYMKEYISHDSAIYARKVVTEIIQRTKKLEQQPNLG